MPGIHAPRIIEGSFSSNERPQLAKLLGIALLVAWAAPLYSSDRGVLTGFNLGGAHAAFGIVPLLLLVFAWASWTGRQWPRLGAIAAVTLFLDVAATLTDGERVLFHPTAWLALVVLICALAAALENRLGALLPARAFQVVPFFAAVLAFAAVIPIYMSFQAQTRDRNPLYTAFAPAATRITHAPPPQPEAVAAQAPAASQHDRAPTAETCSRTGAIVDGAWTQHVPASALVKLDAAPGSPRLRAVLDSGELYSSANGGESWTVTACEPLFRFRGVRFANADDGWAVGDSRLAPAVARTHDGGATWVVRVLDLPATPRIGQLQDLRFWDGRDGVAIADHGVLVTNDGGATWRPSAPAEFHGTTNASEFGDGRLVWLNEDGSSGDHMHRSLDGGETWQSLRTAVSGTQTKLPPLREVRFFANGFGLGVGPAERVYATRDGGETWEETTINGAARPLGRTVLVIGEASAVVLERGREGSLYATEDAAQTWAKVGAAETSAPTCPARLFGTDLRWRLGCDGSLQRTENGGVDWQSVGPFGSAPLLAIAFADSANGWALHAHGALRTTDGGENWLRFDAPGGEDLVAGSLIAADAGWAITKRGTIMRFAGPAAPWRVERTGSDVEGWHDFQMLDAERGWAVGSHGRVLSTRDGGAQWQVRSTLIDETLRAVCFVDRDFGWAVGEHGAVLHSRDGGTSWTKQPLGTGGNFAAVHFRDRNHGWIAGDDAQLLRTNDGGATWQPVAAPGSRPVQSVRFFDDQRGWLAAADGWYRTEDGASTWTKVEMPQGASFSSGHPAGVWFADAVTAWAADRGIWSYRAGDVGDKDR